MECITYRELQRITAVELEERLRHGVMEVSVNGQVWFRIAGRLSRKIDDKNERAVALSRALTVIGGNNANKRETEGIQLGVDAEEKGTKGSTNGGFNSGGSTGITPASTESSGVGSSII